LKVGVLGGTFDPVHNAHLAMADAALTHLSLDEIVFIPTGKPGYRQPAHASAADRVEMLKRALAGRPKLRIDERELKSGASGYTVDTLLALRQELGPQALVYLLIGADQARKFKTWRDPERIRQLAKIGVFGRPGEPVDDPGFEMIPMAPLAISATDIRARAARGEDLSGIVPPAVANYIRERRIYH
jgi:nicotinate-nucleotide adenylyltransferase